MKLTNPQKLLILAYKAQGNSTSFCRAQIAMKKHTFYKALKELVNDRFVVSNGNNLHSLTSEGLRVGGLLNQI